MTRKRMSAWVCAATAVAFITGAALHAAPVTYEGTATISHDTSAFLLSLSDLGFPTGTNLQGQTVEFSVMFDDASFGPDGIPADTSEASYPYTGASSYTFQIDGGNLINNALAGIEIDDFLGLSDVWRADSTLSPGGSRGILRLEGPMTVFDDDSLRTVVDPADFTVNRTFVLALNLGEEGGRPGIEAIIDEIRVTEVPLPAAGGAGLALLGVLLARRARRGENEE